MIVAIIQTRMGSTRLPGKVMKIIDSEYTVLDYVISQLRNCKTLDKIIIATTTLAEDDIIFEYAEKKGIECFRGSSDDVLDRHYQCAKKFSCTDIVRIPSDKPLIDPTIVDDIVNEYKQKSCDYISNFLNNVLPGGILGDLYRIYHTSEDKRKLIELGKSFQSVLFERLSGQLVLFIVFLTSLTFYFLFYEKYVAFFYLLLMMSIIIIIGKLLLRKKFKSFFKRNIFGKNFSSIFSGSIFWQHFFYSFFVISSYISIYVITALSLKLNIDYFSFLVFTPLILFSMSIPISVGGWGVREVTALLVSFLLGLSASASVTVSIVYGLLNFLCSLPGLIFMYYMPTR